MSKTQFKTFVRKKVKEHAFRILNEKKETHIKISQIQYGQLNMQKYLKSPMKLPCSFHSDQNQLENLGQISRTMLTKCV